MFAQKLDVVPRVLFGAVDLGGAVADRAIRQGAGPAGELLLRLELLTLGLALCSALCSRWRNRGLVPYLFTGVLGWAGLLVGLS